MEDFYIEKQIGINLLKVYNKALSEHPLYKKHCKALRNWIKLRSGVLNKCSDCGKICKTHLHHLDFTLKPKNPRVIDLGIWYVPIRNILDLTVEGVIEDYLNKMEIKQTIKYLNVKKSEVIEICPSCHRKRHAILKRNPDVM